VASPRYILDTGPLVAFANAADTHHAWVRHVLDALGEPPLACAVVLAEACYLLANSQRAVERVLALPALGQVLLAPVLGPASDYVRVAVTKYWPEMDVADGCVLWLAEMFPRAKVITTDVRHFSLYRRQRNVALVLIHP
jgi:predicted nucleic acid-binding protein